MRADGRSYAKYALHDYLLAVRQEQSTLLSEIRKQKRVFQFANGRAWYDPATILLRG